MEHSSSRPFGADAGIDIEITGEGALIKEGENVQVSSLEGPDENGYHGGLVTISADNVELQAGNNVNLSSTTSGLTTTYTISAEAGGDSGGSVDINGGNNIDVINNGNSTTINWNSAGTPLDCESSGDGAECYGTGAIATGDRTTAIGAASTSTASGSTSLGYSAKGTAA